MNIKKAIIATNDALAYLSFAIVALVSLTCVLNGKIGAGIMVAVIGWIVCSLVMGLWFVLSDIAGSVRKIPERE